MKNAESYGQTIIETLRANAQEENRQPMENYMRNHFPFLGIKSPERKELWKEFFRINGKPELEWLEALAYFLYAQPEREFHYAALSMIDVHKKSLTIQHLPFLEKLITSNSWWDTIDHLAPHHVGTILLKDKKAVGSFPDNWINSPNFWLQRSAILYQLKYKKMTDEEKLFFYISSTKNSKEFFVQKAIGWALREYSKTSPKVVMDFIQKTDLAPLSRREGVKHMERQGLKVT
ncbi:DNA alkylation repair protein [Bacillus sp. THAF10]|uniref:DNA alkylation repair protein n=1 Tax=Bacillus sp. THAF10 TaxID=2587848 RepID=UPI0012683154|nr:DNA alkylation repair protein [Bacillus sp. THAF10]